MKSVQQALPLLLVALASSAAGLRADSNPTSSDDSSMWIDPDAVPRAFVPKPAITQGQRAAMKERQKQVLDKKEWMLRGYATQLQELAKQKEGPEESSTDLEETAQLARAAGLSVEDFSRTDREQPEASAEEKAKTPSSPAPTDVLAAPGQLMIFKPLLSSNPSGSPLSFGQALPPLSATSQRASSDDSEPEFTTKASDDPGMANRENSGDMDIPGLTAADSNSATRQSLGLTDEDLLPGEPASATEKSHRALALELPPTTDTERLDKIQTDATKAPGQATKKATAPAAPPEPQSDTEQMVHDPTPIRARVEDPFDILR